MFLNTKVGTIARLSKKMMGEQNGTCPVEEVFSMSSVDPGRIQDLGCGDDTLADETQTGLDCFGAKTDIDTKGGNADDPLCASQYCGEFAFGVDAYGPNFYSYERRMPTICVDAASTSPREVKGTLQAIRNDGPKLIMNDLDFLMWDLVLQRGPGNTSIAQTVEFGADRGLSNGQFPYLPQGYLNHEFIKRIQEIVMMDPDNRGKSFTVEASHHQIEKAIEDDQRQKGIDRGCARVIEEPYRAEMIQMYDGIRYLSKDMADYVGAIDHGTHCTFIRPRRHVHQAGTEYGTVARPNYGLMEGCTINCNGRSLPKYEVIHWYLEDSVSYVPFIAPMNVPTSGEERIKDNVYADPSAFKTYWVAPHAVETPGGCPNDRNQFQQMGQRVVFGLFNRPDRIDHGAILAQPVHRCITLVNNCCPDDEPAEATKAVSREDDLCDLHGASDCEACDGSADTSGGGSIVATGAGTFSLPFGTTLTRVEGNDTEATICVTRSGGSDGVASIDLDTADGTAIAATNYTAIATTTLTWADGETGDKCVTVTLLDADIAAAVDFTVVASSATGAAAPAEDTTTVTINPTPA
ncbi:MAG: hypothetical protein GY871_13330 [Actinomycetales bacterium]|nr:hypothetical protein [Actinomycetales bacterium]